MSVITLIRKKADTSQEHSGIIPRTSSRWQMLTFFRVSHPSWDGFSFPLAINRAFTLDAASAALDKQSSGDVEC